MDEDENAAPIEYQITNITFNNLGKYDQYSSNMMNLAEKLFQIDGKTGELKTVNSLQKYTNGYFDVAILAKNTPEFSRAANMSVRVGRRLFIFQNYYYFERTIELTSSCDSFRFSC